MHRKRAERPNPESKGSQDASERFSVLSSAVGFADSFMSRTDSCESCVHSLNSLVAIQREGDSIRLSLQLLISKTWAVGAARVTSLIPPSTSNILDVVHRGRKNA